MPRFRKKPVEIEAVRFKFVEEGCPIFADHPPEWVLDGFSIGLDEPGAIFVQAGVLRVRTHQGVADVNPGDVLIQQIDGEINPCRPDLFAATYEPVTTEEIPL